VVQCTMKLCVHCGVVRNDSDYSFGSLRLSYARCRVCVRGPRPWGQPTRAKSRAGEAPSEVEDTLGRERLVGGNCLVCAGSERLSEHHHDYYGDSTIPLCASCHGRLHHNLYLSGRSDELLNKP
jgi:hypothetical protein